MGTSIKHRARPHRGEWERCRREHGDTRGLAGHAAQGDVQMRGVGVHIVGMYNQARKTMFHSTRHAVSKKNVSYDGKHS